LLNLTLEKYNIMKGKSLFTKLGICLSAGLLLASCTKDPNSPGYEYFPDMYRSASQEAYLDYNHPDQQSARIPAAGSIPFSSDPSKAWVNFPYPYPTDVTGYELSVNLKNPVEFSEDMITEAGDVYLKFCAHCHGEAGDGKGQIALNGKIDGIPGFADRKALTDGQLFHSISYGKGVMGAHAPLLSKEERWKLVHWIRRNIDAGYTGSIVAINDSTVTADAPVEAVQPN
jgi:mono/diheme cytochrome c family protein